MGHLSPKPFVCCLSNQLANFSSNDPAHQASGCGQSGLADHEVLASCFSDVYRQGPKTVDRENVGNRRSRRKLPRVSRMTSAMASRAGAKVRFIDDDQGSETGVASSRGSCQWSVSWNVGLGQRMIGSVSRFLQASTCQGRVLAAQNIKCLSLLCTRMNLRRCGEKRGRA